MVMVSPRTTQHYVWIRKKPGNGFFVYAEHWTKFKSLKLSPECRSNDKYQIKKESYNK
jgi:hypothetical protein